MGGASKTFRKLLSSHAWEVKEQNSNSGSADATVFAFLLQETMKNKAFTEVTFLLGLERRVRFPGSLGSEVEGGLGLAGMHPSPWQRPVRAGEETRAGRGQRGGRHRHGKLACGEGSRVRDLGFGLHSLGQLPARPQRRGRGACRGGTQRAQRGVRQGTEVQAASIQAPFRGIQN